MSFSLSVEYSGIKERFRGKEKFRSNLAKKLFRETIAGRIGLDGVARSTGHNCVSTPAILLTGIHGQSGVICGIVVIGFMPVFGDRSLAAIARVNPEFGKLSSESKESSAPPLPYSGRRIYCPLTGFEESDAMGLKFNCGRGL